MGQLRYMLRLQITGSLRLIRQETWSSWKPVIKERSFNTSGRNNSKVIESLSNYWSSLKWFSIPASVGFAYICYLQFRHTQKRERVIIATGKPEDLLFPDWQVDIIKKFPTRFLSRLWGNVCNIQIPEFIRSPVLSLYVKMFNCHMEDALIEDLNQYGTFHDFFTRRLKPAARNIDERNSLVSPVDGTVLHFGKLDITCMKLEQVKGVTYPLDLFIGPKHSFAKNITVDTSASMVTDEGIIETGNNGDGLDVYFCNIYLAPGDYHWFHSPADWKILDRRHIPGILLSVSPFSMKSIRGVFNLNERVLLSGKWKHGSMLMAAIGAYNVGSIHLNFSAEKGFETNSTFAKVDYSDRLYGGGIDIQRGDSIGYFSLGSSIVLVFTAPKQFKFHIQHGQTLKLGEPLGTVLETSNEQGG